MATNTYVALKTSTVTGSAVSSVTIDNIPGGYTDLVLVAQPLKTLSGGGTMRVQFNGDTSSVYSGTVMYQENNTTWSDRAANANYARIGFWNGNSAGNTVVAHFQNYANTNVHKTFLLKTGNASAIVGAGVQLWRSTAAITSMYIYNDGGNFDVGSTFTVYGIANADTFAKATGGTLYEDSTYWYHVFGASGTFTPKQSLTADILVVAGGGGGGGARVSVHYAGGGGAGGVLGFASQSLTTTPYTVTVGAGGGGGGGSYTVAYNGAQGGNSQFGALTAAVGGGYGATASNAGGNGGSGGGGGSYTGTPAGGSGTSGQGYAGGTGGIQAYVSGGGGGAGAAGANSSSSSNGLGGSGVNTVTNWGSLSSVLTATRFSPDGYIAGGGQGSAASPASSLGGGGKVGEDSGGSGGVPATAGAMYTGSGGGAGSANGTQNGAAGGSGVVIIRYPK